MRKPDLTIGPADDPQTERWHLFRWRGIQVAIHKWHRSDTDRALHDHSADNISVLLWGRYREWFSHAWEAPRWKLRWPLIPYFRKAETAHRVELHRGAPVWTLWIRFKPRREWGFHCPKGWRHWKEYVAEREGYYQTGHSTVGKGCG
jgi:hypothetical protein